MINKNWVEKAAEEICFDDSLDNPTPARMAAIIEKHCPFKKNTAYEEVDERFDKLQKSLDELFTMIKFIRSQVR